MNFKHSILLKHISLLIYLLLISCIFVIVSCHRRYNPLLPPNLLPEDYMTSQFLNVTGTYLIKSSNDNAYLLINKQAFADTIIQVGDYISFYRWTSFSHTDTLHIAGDYSELSYAYAFYIWRNNSFIDLKLPHLYPYITIYSDRLSDSFNKVYCLRLNSWLEGVHSEIKMYPHNRLSFHPYGTGFNQIYSIPTGGSNLSFTAQTGNHYGWLAGTRDRISFFLPVVSNHTSISISNSEILDTLLTPKLLHVFPNFIVFSSVTSFYSSLPLGNSSSAPLMKLTNNNFTKTYPFKWVVENNNQLYAWDESPETWSVTDTDLIAPCRINGTYLWIIPMQEPSLLNIPLDLGLRQCYIQNMWLDLKNINISGYSLNVNLNPDFQTVKNQYFSGNPYLYTATISGIEFTLFNHESEVSSLPDNQWFELGLKLSDIDINAYWFRYYQTSTESILAYKTNADRYDAEHYTVIDNYLYTSVSFSGKYFLLHPFTNSDTIVFPVLKTKAFLQTPQVSVYWDQADLNTYDKLMIDLSPTYDLTHPWLNGHPYSISNPNAALSSYFYKENNKLSSVPNVFTLYYQKSTQQYFNHIINWSLDAKSAIAKLIRLGTTLDIDHFVMLNNMISVSPSFGGVLIQGEITNLNSNNFDIALFQSMSIDFDTVKVWMNSSNPVPIGSMLNVEIYSTMNDSLNILTTQYNLTQLSPVYHLTVSSPLKKNRDFYSTHQPLVYLKRFSRRTEYLFTIADNSNNRIYTYEQGNQADGYHYCVENSYNVFYLVHDGQFASFADNLPHNFINQTVQPIGHDLILSLYQAQMILPVYFTTQTSLHGFSLKLEKLTNYAGLPNAISAYRVGWYNQLGQPVQANFITDFQSLRFPLIFIPFPSNYVGQTISLFFQDATGITNQLTQVSTLGTSDREFILWGNCAICFVNNPGIYYFTLINPKKTKSSK